MSNVMSAHSEKKAGIKGTCNNTYQCIVHYMKHIHIYIHVHTHVHVHTYMYTLIQIDTHMYMYMYKRTLIQIDTHMYMYKRTLYTYMYNVFQLPIFLPTGVDILGATLG